MTIVYIMLMIWLAKIWVTRRMWIGRRWGHIAPLSCLLTINMSLYFIDVLKRRSSWWIYTYLPSVQYRVITSLSATSDPFLYILNIYNILSRFASHTGTLNWASSSLYIRYYLTRTSIAEILSKLEYFQLNWKWSSLSGIM